MYKNKVLIEKPLADGLTEEQVCTSRKIYGENKLHHKKHYLFWEMCKSIFSEPMVLLLLGAAGLYILNGQYNDAVFMGVAIFFIAGISLYQDNRSQKALLKLEQFTQPLCTVIRNAVRQSIATEEIVVGDVLIVEEGRTIPADGIILQSNDFSLNESILTGESLAVFKDEKITDNKVFSGTMVASGLAVLRVIAIGSQTSLGKIGHSLETIKKEKTPLELQISNFVKKMIIAGILVFVLVWSLHFLQNGSIIQSLLQALTLAMSILPEEIPVAFTSFMALGAWRLMKMGIVVKQMKTVETLGSTTVICTDKTGTLTQNKMDVAKLCLPSGLEISVINPVISEEAVELVKFAMWASEPIPFDPMEIALHVAYTHLKQTDERSFFNIIHEYPLSGKPPMMTHIFENSKQRRIVAAKGASEAILELCKLSTEQYQLAIDAEAKLASKGYRVLAVGKGTIEGVVFPNKQQDILFEFMGLIAFYDPPRKNILEVLTSFYTAGMKVKIITGDNVFTTSAIAKEIGLRGCEKAISGEELMKLSDRELKNAVLDYNVFSRMFPEAKLKIVNALKENGEIVAMVGDGVNDGPALKSAHIGIAMGKKGSAIAQEAAAIILADDDLSKMIDAIAMGRRIYINLKKAIRYILSIHIPIIFIVLVPLLLGKSYPNIFGPLHIVLLELIMGPTCSIIYENELAEKDVMKSCPRVISANLFTLKEFIISIIQGLFIALGSLTVYYWSVHQNYSSSSIRSMVFITLMTSNLFLTLINRSFRYSIFVSIHFKNKLVSYIICISVLLVVLLFSITQLRLIFGFVFLTVWQWASCFFIGLISVIWYDMIKLLQKNNKT